MSRIKYLNELPFDSGCVFCRMKFDDDLSSEPTNQLLYSGEFHYVISGLGALTPGYLLLITHRHFENYSLIPAEYQKEFNYLFAKIEQLIVEEFGEVTIFEHGGVDDKGTGGGCINHAHVHFIAKNVDINRVLKQEFREIVIMKTGPSCRHLPPLRTPYLYVKQKDEEARVFSVDRSLPTQFLRQKMAAEMEMSKYWDYKLYPFNENIMKTIRMFEDKLR